MSISAMKQALAELEKQHNWMVANGGKFAESSKKSIFALEKAIAEVEKQEPVIGTKTWFEDGKMVTQHLYASDINQERVDETAKDRHEWVEMQCPCGHKMYVKHTGREWVGLTDEAIWLEYQHLWPFHPAEEPTLAKDIAKFARAIEAKLNILNRAGFYKKREWVGLDYEQMRNTPLQFNRGALWAERYLKEKNT